MKNKKLSFLLVLVLLFLINDKVIPQVVHSQHRTPIARIQQRTKKLHKICSLPSNEINNLLKQDSIEVKAGDYPFRFGKNIDVDIDFIKESTLDIKGDTSFYTYEINSPSAFSINLIFDQFGLNNNSSLYIYNSEGDFVYGPVTSVNNASNGIFWTDIIKGDHIVIELIELNNNNKKNQLHISSVIHGYKDIFAIPNNYGDSYSCNIDIACSQGNDWRVEGNAVAMLILANGTRLCSGSLINNTANDFKSYLLTAFHCLDIGATNCSLTDAEKSAPNNWLFRLHYESPTCGGVEGTDYITINGASFRAAYQPTDFALLELMTTPIFATYSGWQRNSSAASSGVGIHHPVGDVKKISFDNHTLTYASQIYWSDGCTTPANTHWQVGFDEGTTEGGSSGSPILNPNHRIVGQLHGGYPGCPPVTKYYGRFDKSWTGGGTNTTRLSNWIDPTSSGVTYLNTKYSISSTISGSFVICLGYSSSYTVNNVPSNSTIFWENSSNLTRISAQSSNPCTFSSTANGLGWIRVKIRNNTDNSFVTLPQYPIWVGKFDATVVTGQAAVCPDELYTYIAKVPGGHSSSYNYDWTYPGNWIWQAEMENWIRLKTPKYNPQYGTVRVAITNACGTAGPSGITVYPGYNCGGYYMAFPNPGSNYVDIDVNPKMSTSMEEIYNNDISLSLYNKMGTVVLNSNVESLPYRIDTSVLPNGEYVVKIITRKKGGTEKDQRIESLKITVNH